MLKVKQYTPSKLWVNTHQGTFIYALHLKDEVVHVGQCMEVQSRIDKHLRTKDFKFDRFTYTFLEGVQPYSYEANLMEAVAISQLKPAIEVKPAQISQLASIQPIAGELEKTETISLKSLDALAS